MSPTPDSTLNDSQQIIADLQRKLAERTAERDQARAERDEDAAQKAAVAEVLQVINSSPGDLAPVFDAILEKARSLCGAEFGTLMVRDGALIPALSAHGVPEAFAEILKRGVEPGLGNPAARLIGGEPLLHISDLAVFAAQIPEDPVARAAVELGGVRTVSFVPLRKNDALLGFIAAFRQEVRPFTNNQIALLQNFAAQAVIAMENTRLLTETREALEQQTATAEVLQVINASPGDLKPVFDAIVERAHNLCGASRGTLFLFDGGMFRAAASQGYTGGSPELERIRHGISVAEAPRLAALLAGERLIHVPDLTQFDDPMARAVASGGVRANLLLPLRKDGALLGVLSCNRTEVQPFSDAEIAQTV